MQFSQTALETIKEQVDIVDLISSYISLKRSTRNFVGLCPFHNEKTPSFNVNHDKGFFHCFGCKASGDVIKFISLYENLDFKDSLKFLADRYSITIIAETPYQKKQTSEKILLYELYQETANWFTQQLSTTNGQHAKEYLKSRNISPQEIQKFQIGYAPDSWNSLLKYLTTKNYTSILLKNSGLFSQKDENGNLYDRFRNRLMFSICNKEGKVIAFSGRILTDEKSQAKYINSPETLIFKKKKTLYGFHLARQNFSKHQFALLCEGQIDVIACHRAGLDNAISSQGTAFTDEHAQDINRYAEDAIVAFDGDTAGHKAALKSIDPFLKVGLIPKICQLKDGLDPDSILNTYGAKTLKDNINNSSDFFTFALNYFQKIYGFTSPGERTKVTYNIAELLSKLSDPIQLSFYVQELSHKLKLTANELSKIIKKKSPDTNTSNQLDEQFSPIQAIQSNPLELNILELALSSQQTAEKLATHFTKIKFSQSAIGEILTEFLGLVEMGEWGTAHEKMITEYSISHTDIAPLIINNQYSNISAELQKKATSDCLIKIFTQENKKHLDSLAYQLENPHLLEQEKNDILQEFLLLNQKKQQINKKFL